MSCITIWRTLGKRQNDPKNSLVKFVLAHLFRDYSEWVKHFDRCQRMGNINKRNEMPLQGILVVQIFYVWGINLDLSHPHLEIYTFSLLWIMYPNGVEAIVCPINDAKIVVGLFKETS